MLLLVASISLTISCTPSRQKSIGKTSPESVFPHRRQAAELDAEEQKLRLWVAGAQVSVAAVEKYGRQHCFAVEELPDSVFLQMKGRSFPRQRKIGREELRYLRVLCYTGNGETRLGAMVCHHRIAEDLKDIFQRLYDAHYPIERMVPIDFYNANDERSMRANNTSCFCFRPVAGSGKLSSHSRGMAVDVNPLYNPHCKRHKGKLLVAPSTAATYADRSKSFPYKVERGDLCYRLFRQHGFRWGGDWRTSKDYQHFEKD